MKYPYVFLLAVFIVSHLYAGLLKVTPSHELVDGGVKFAIEDVDPLEGDQFMDPITDEEHKEKISSQAMEYYTLHRFNINTELTDEELIIYKQLESEKRSEDRACREAVEGRHMEIYKRANKKYESRIKEQKQNILEVYSEMPPNLVYSGNKGFFKAVNLAFAKHRPLVMKPDHIWGLILYAFIRHVDKYPEELRDKFVSHQGKRELEITFDGKKEQTTPEQWQTLVFPQFSELIKNNMKSEELYEIVRGEFSDSSDISQACKEIGLMSATKNYFEYKMGIKCGIPSIILKGEEKDWSSLRDRTDKLSNYMMPEFSQAWMPKLKPILEEFHESYKGNVNHEFWQKMVKIREIAGGSGPSDTYVTGWINTLYPILNNGDPNSKMKPWKELTLTDTKSPSEVGFSISKILSAIWSVMNPWKELTLSDTKSPSEVGVDISKIPGAIWSVPVNWETLSGRFKVHFHAGIVGCTQDRENDGAFMPVEGWSVSHDPDHYKTKPDNKHKENQFELVNGH